MRVRWTALLLTMAVLLQALALTPASAAWLKSHDLMHSVLHWMGEEHHHHDDGTWHLDDSAAASQHVAGDHLNSPAALPVSADLVAFFSYRDAPAGDHAGGLPHPHLEGPLRPPRLV